MAFTTKVGFGRRGYARLFREAIRVSDDGDVEGQAKARELVECLSWLGRPARAPLVSPDLVGDLRKLG
jgi:hypothetical protein